MGLVNKEDVVLELEGTTQKEILHQLALKAYELNRVESAETFYEQLCLREKEATTGFGNGIAIPHARHKCVKQAGIIIARCQNEIEWNSMDEKPVQTCICLIAPDDKNDFHLAMLSKLARKLIYEDFVEMLKHGDIETLVQEVNKVLEN